MYQIIWQSAALVGFSELLYYLDTHYGAAAGEQLLSDVNRKIDLLQNNPFIYRQTRRKPSLRRCLINHHTVLYYQVNKAKRTIRLLAFWDTRRNPDQSPE
jgi:plasmid stabilization system protein ParE